MTPEEKIKDFKGAKIFYYSYETRAYFKSAEDTESFAEWLDQNEYTVCVTYLCTNFYKNPIHYHRLKDYKKYPALLLGKKKIS